LAERGMKMTTTQYFSVYEQGGYRHTLRRLLGRGIDISQAEDLTQTAWLRGWQHLDQLRDESLVEPWVTQIAMNRYLDTLKGDARTWRLPDGLDFCAPQTTGAAAVDVERVLGMLSPRHRLVLRWFYIDECPCAVMAERMGVSVDAIYRELSRARQAARQKLALPSSTKKSEGSARQDSLLRKALKAA
jgi:DNA-directed RNA polymerase specialized sigma24 family protein